MARPKGDKPSTSSMFKRYFAEKPDLLQVSSLDEVINRYQQENPNATVTPQLRQIAANVKSTLKKKGRLSSNGRGRKRGRPKGSGKAAAAAPLAAARGGATLEKLEGRIDDCLALAREIDPRGLTDVIRQLRRALAGVILRQ